MPWISHRLRLPDGCPWDREQTHESLRNHLLEEAYEVYDALAAGATPALAEELGDLLLQVDPPRPARGRGRRLRPDRRRGHPLRQDRPAPPARLRRRRGADRERRQPPVGADQGRRAARPRARRPGTPQTRPPEGRARRGQPEPARRSRRARRCRTGRPTSATSGRPSRASSTRSTRRWPSCRAAGTPAEQTEEYGDLLFVLVNVARWQGIEAEAALRGANDKFRRRFASVERQAFERGVALKDLAFEQLDELWDAAKVEEKAQHQAPDQEKEIAR